MKGSYGRRRDVRKLREVLELLTELSDMKLELQIDAIPAEIDNIFKALISALASPRVQSLTLVGSAYGSNPKQSFQFLLSQFTDLKTLVLHHCRLETLEAIRFPSEHGIEHLYILPWNVLCSSADLHSSRVEPPTAYCKWASSSAKLMVQLLQNFTALIVDARNFLIVDTQLTSLTSSLSPGIRMRMIGFVFASAHYQGMLASSSEAHAWALFITGAIASGVQTMSITLAPDPLAEEGECRMPLIRSQCEQILARADPLRKLKVRYAVVQDADGILSSDRCLLPM